MRYLVLHLRFGSREDFVADVFANYLGEIGFESFIPVPDGLDAYIPEKNFRKQELDELIHDFPFEVTATYEYEVMEDKNWNEEWEKHFFNPITIDNQCVIHSSFHKDIPQMKYDIIIDPKMSFGTGHHETTSLMVSEILKMDLKGKTVLDMGCGTSVLAILASMKGASSVTAIDIDDWCVENSLENIAMNNINNIQVMAGDASLLPGMHFDVILANINRNILLNDMHKYAGCLAEEGNLFMSGFYSEDVPVIISTAARYGLKMDYSNSKNNWTAVKMTKQN